VRLAGQEYPDVAGRLVLQLTKSKLDPVPASSGYGKREETGTDTMEMLHSRSLPTQLPSNKNVFSTSLVIRSDCPFYIHEAFLVPF